MYVMCLSLVIHTHFHVSLSLQGLQFPLSHLQALRQLQQVEQLAVDELQLPTQEDKLSLVLALWSESLLVVV